MSNVLNRMRTGLRRQKIDEKTAKSMLFWARSFLLFCDNNAPERLGRSDIEGFLEHLKRERFAGRAGRQRALEAIAQMYRYTDDGTPEWLKIMVEEARGPATANILSRQEVGKLLEKLRGPDWLAAAIIYGTGIRLLECMRLRARDLDLKSGTLHIRGENDEIQRSLAIPGRLVPELSKHLDRLREDHLRAISLGKGRVWIPDSLAEQSPATARQWSWQYLFPALPTRSEAGASVQSKPSEMIRHTDPKLLHRKFERAAIEAGIHRRVTGHVLRNSHAVHMLEKGVPLRRLEQLLGARDAPPSGGSTEKPLLSIPGAGNSGTLPAH